MKRQGGRSGRAARSALRTAQSMATAKRKGRGRAARSALQTAQSKATARRKGRGRTARSTLRTAQGMATARRKGRGRTARFHPQNRRASPVPPAMAKSRIGKSGHVARLEGRIPPPTADERGRKPRKQRSAGHGGALRGDCGPRGSINANGRFHHRFPNRPASFRDGARTSDGLKAASPSAASKTGAPACRTTTLQAQERLTFQTIKKVAVKPAGCNGAANERLVLSQPLWKLFLNGIRDNARNRRHRN